MLNLKTSETDARRVTTRTDLVGGPGALGELGDVVLNAKIKLIIQDKGYSRGFGVYGGGIIDADIVRPTPTTIRMEQWDAIALEGAVSVYFLQALNPREVEILEKSDSGMAKVRVA